MVFPQGPPMSYDQMYEDRERALEQRPAAGEQLPAYSDAVKGQSPAYITEKEMRQQHPKQSRSSGKMSTIKSILTGDVHKHNPRYVLEESVTGRPSVARSPRPGTTSSKSSQSTLKSILTGDVQKYHPMYRLEESVDPHMRNQMRNVSN